MVSYRKLPPKLPEITEKNFNEHSGWFGFSDRAEEVAQTKVMFSCRNSYFIHIK